MREHQYYLVKIDTIAFSISAKCTFGMFNFTPDSGIMQLNAFDFRKSNKDGPIKYLILQELINFPKV